jgi:hypothetical protein
MTTTTVTTNVVHKPITTFGHVFVIDPDFSIRTVKCRQTIETQLHCYQDLVGGEVEGIVGPTRNNNTSRLLAYVNSNGLAMAELKENALGPRVLEVLGFDVMDYFANELALGMARGPVVLVNMPLDPDDASHQDADGFWMDFGFSPEETDVLRQVAALCHYINDEPFPADLLAILALDDIKGGKSTSDKINQRKRSASAASLTTPTNTHAL